MSKDLAKLSKEELVEYINELRKQLNNEKYGLYFDRKATPEEIVEYCKNNFPVLIRDEDRELFRGGKGHNILIEGDNFPVLTSLASISPQEGFVDIIYIDPPYNTGIKDFIYNDKFIDNEDGYRHTKWLNFMEKRLRIAKDLMKDDGVLFVSIDHNEHAQLKLLCNSIFGEHNFVSDIVWISNPNGRGDDEYIGRIHEYVLVYRKSDKLVFNTAPQDIKQFNKQDEKGPYAEQILYSKLTYSKGMDYIIKAPDGTSIYAGGDKEAWELRQKGRNTKKDYTWRWSETKFKEELEKGEAIIKKVGKEWKVYRKRRPTDNGAPYKGFYDAEGTRHGTSQIKEIFNAQPFDHPKPTGLIKYLIGLKSGEDNIVLDFFAGSGTTGQAVLELNEEKGTKNKFILCNNNENNIMTDVCYPRIKTIITGEREDGTRYSDGLKANLRYFRTGFVESTLSKDQDKYNLVEKCDGLLNIKENIFDKVDFGINFNIYSNKKESRIMGIYNNYFETTSFEEMLKKMKKVNMSKNIVYYFSLDNSVDEALEELVKKIIPNVNVKPIPSKIYEIYRKISDDLKREY
jgi:adenine-specific DNA-methyltransferase